MWMASCVAPEMTIFRSSDGGRFDLNRGEPHFDPCDRRRSHDGAGLRHPRIHGTCECGMVEVGPKKPSRVSKLVFFLENWVFLENSMEVFFKTQIIFSEKTTQILLKQMNLHCGWDGEPLMPAPPRCGIMSCIGSSRCSDGKFQLVSGCRNQFLASHSFTAAPIGLTRFCGFVSVVLNTLR